MSITAMEEAEPGFIYFIGCAEVDAVKIGYTKSSPYARLKALQTGNPHKLDLLLYVDGFMSEERDWHGTFAADRLEGEWFRFSPAIKETIIKYRIGYQMRPDEVGYGWPR